MALEPSLGYLFQNALGSFEMKLDGRNRPSLLGGDLPNGSPIYPKSPEYPARPIVHSGPYHGRKKLL